METLGFHGSEGFKEENERVSGEQVISEEL